LVAQEHEEHEEKHASGGQLPRLRGDKLKKLGKWVMVFDE